MRKPLARRRISTIFEASGTKIDDFADIVGEETVEAFKKGEGSSKQMEDALQKLGDTLLGTGGDSEKLKENLDRLDDGVSFEKLQKEAVESGAKFDRMGKEQQNCFSRVSGRVILLGAGKVYVLPT